jgi:hypothetical protein
MRWQGIAVYLATGWEGLRPLLLLPYRVATVVSSRIGSEVRRVLLPLSRRLKQGIEDFWRSGQEERHLAHPPRTTWEVAIAPTTNSLTSVCKIASALISASTATIRTCWNC